MKSIDFIKTNQLYFFVSLYFFAGSVTLSFFTLSMNVYILINGFILIGVPALFLAYRYKGATTFKQYIRLHPVHLKTIGYSMLVPIAVMPIIMTSNLLVTFFLPDIPSELNNEEIVGNIAIALQIIGLGLCPGFFEELLFRGVLIKGVEKNNKHFAIFYIAFLFALLHLNPYNFIGPFILGVVFGYMLYATNSIVPSMIAHMTNNLLAVFFLYISRKMESLVENKVQDGGVDTAISDISTSSIVFTGMVLIGMVMLSYFLIIFLLRKMKEEEQREEEKVVESKESIDLKKKEKWSILFVAPMIILFLCVLFTL